jgi:hypothetical protein
MITEGAMERAIEMINGDWRFMMRGLSSVARAT